MLVKMRLPYLIIPFLYALMTMNLKIWFEYELTSSLLFAKLWSRLSDNLV